MMSMTRRALARFILGTAVICGCVPFGGTTTVGSGSSVGLVVDAASLSVAEGGTTALGVRLSENPGRSVVVTASLSGAANPFQVTEGATLPFGVADWDTVKFIRVLSKPDSNTTHDSSTLRIEVDGRFFFGITVGEVDSGASAPPPEPPPAEEPPAETPPAPAPVPPAPVPPVQPVDPGEPQEGVTLTVKDASGVGAIDYPVTAIVPVSYGVYQDTTRFRIVDGQGNPVPAQFEVLNRWPMRDNSIRHVVAHFQASVGAAGKAFYAFQTKGAGPAPQKSVRVTDGAGVVTVDTGAVKFTVKKSGFNLFDEVWLDTNGDGAYAASERIVAPSSDVGATLTDRNGAKQRASDRSDLRIVIEESGPMRSVIRVSSLSKFFSATDHRHGFAARIYAYAGKSFVKVDYQLQNSAKNVRYSAPLFFDDVTLSVRPTLTSPTARFAAGAGNVWSGAVSSGRYLLQSSLTASSVNPTAGGAALLSGSNVAAEASCGWGDLSDSQRGVFVTVRNMAEMWPNALEVSSDNTVSIGLWPRQSSQYHAGAMSSSGLYWLEDMQHVYKESLIYFHGANVASTDLDRLAKTFQYHPIPFVPVAEYARTKVTLDLGGLIPISDAVGGTDTRRILFTPSYIRDQSVTQGNTMYNFGWANFLGDVGRKSPGGAGGISYSSGKIIATERVDEWLTGEGAAIGELNCRPQSMAEYKYPEDYALIQPSQDPYGGRSWRAHVTGFESDLPNVVDYLPGTGYGGWKPRDNEHGWFYHVEEFYYLSANPWIRDWYEFVGEFRKTERSNPGLPNWSFLSKQGWETTRGEAHGFAHALQAFRITGDKSIIEWARQRLDNFETHRDPEYGTFHDGGGWFNVGSVFEHGYQIRALAQIYEEVENYDREIQDRVLNLIWGTVAWNDGHASFGYIVTNRDPKVYPTPSAGSAMVIADPHAWFAWKTGSPQYLGSLNGYIDGGLNGGGPPYIDVANLKSWTGASLGRPTHYVRKYVPVADGPAKVSNLTARAVSGKVEISFTTPASATRVHVIYSTLPISATYTKDATKRNPWGCTVVPNTLVAKPGTTQSLQFGGAPAGKTIHVAVIMFNEQGHMGALSNVATVTAP